MNIKIEKIGINGEGIGYYNRQPVFIEGALVGEIVDVRITDKQPRFCRGKIVKIVEKSKDRKPCECKYLSQCGICSLMHTKYEKQLDNKYSLLRQSLIKYAQINPKYIRKVKSNADEFEHYNAFKLPIAAEEGKLVCGLYMPSTNYFVGVDTCIAHEQGLERIKKELLSIFNKYKLKPYNFHEKMGIRTLILRGFEGQYQCTIVTGEHPLIQDCIDECNEIEGLASLWQSYNVQKKTSDLFGKVMVHLGGTRLLPFTFNNFKLNISPKSVFPINTKQANTLFQSVADLIKGDNELIVDAYCGIGVLSLFVKDKAKEVIGIDSMNDAISNANVNIKNNKVKNVNFICGEVVPKLVSLSKKGNIDVLMLSPDKTGLDDDMISCILRSKIKNIIYISSNPATLGKNLANLQNRYYVEAVVPIDMLSNTVEVSSVVKLCRK